MILELQNPRALDLPEIRALFARAFDNHPQVDGETVLSELQHWLGHEKLTVLLVRDDTGTYRGLSIILFPATRLFAMPQVYHFHFNGPRALREELIQATLLAIRRQGYDKFATTNLNGRERAFQRLFRSAGDMVELGDFKLYEVRVNQEAQSVRSG